MQTDIIGRVRNTKLPKVHGLMPVFEAIVNSITAIAEAGGTPGTIRIRIGRDRQESLDLHGNALSDIDYFVIEDDGIGFTEANYRSFDTMDSRAKEAIGGKGIGRLYWLKAFDHAEIKSVYHEDGSWYRRNFSFRLSNEGIEAHDRTELTAPPSPARPSTIVRLRGFKAQYRTVVPKSADTIARRIVEHCMEYLLLGDSPKMILVDDEEDLEVDLDELFQNEYKPASTSRIFMVGEDSFSLTDVLLNARSDSDHKVLFCAHNRVVEHLPLTHRIPHLDRPFQGEEEAQLVYCGYVTSKFLDDRVDSDRTSFEIDREDRLAFSGGPTWESLVESTVEAVTEFLAPHTEGARKRSEARVRDFIEQEAPRYRPLLRHRKEVIEAIPGSLPDSSLDLKLYQAMNDWRHEVRVAATEKLEQLPEDPSDFEAHSEDFRRVLGDLQEVAKSDLADYVVHRAAVLSFFEKLLGRQSDDKFAREDALHGLFFPQRTTSDDVDYNEHSLWMLDERLAYHRYLASDKRFDQQESPVTVDSADRPDLLIYNRRMAFSSGEAPYSTVVVVEFKRPERKDYSDEKSPIRQVLDYVRQVRSGEAERPDGSSIKLSPNTPFYCYLVATMNKKLEKEAEDFGFTLAPDGLGYFHFNEPLKTYIEISSYHKVLEDAKKRNRAFFDQLQIRFEGRA